MISRSNGTSKFSARDHETRDVNLLQITPWFLSKQAAGKEPGKENRHQEPWIDTECTLAEEVDAAAAAEPTGRHQEAAEDEETLNRNLSGCLLAVRETGQRLITVASPRERIRMRKNDQRSEDQSQSVEIVVPTPRHVGAVAVAAALP